MAKYDGLLGQPVLEVEEPDKEDGITIIFKDNRFMFIKVVDGNIETVSIPEWDKWQNLTELECRIEYK